MAYSVEMTEFLRTALRFRFPLNPNPVIFSGRYTGIGNGIAHSNGHRFPPTAVAAGGRSRRGTMPGDDIANIWLDSGANVLGCMPRGAPALAPPLKRGRVGRVGVR